MDLRKKISDSVNKAYEKPLQDYIQVDKVYWYPTTSDYTGDNIRIFDIKIQCFDFFCIESLMLLALEEGIKIYEYTKEMGLKNVKSVRHHYLLFLIKKRALNENIKNFFYKILLVLVRDKTTRIESHLEGIMLYLNIDEIFNINEYKNYIEIEYKNGEKKSYNNKLCLIDPNKIKEHQQSYCDPSSLTIEASGEDQWHPTNTLSFPKNTLIAVSTKNIFIFKNFVRIEFNSGTTQKEIAMKRIEKAVESGNFLFVKNRFGIKALHFN